MELAQQILESLPEKSYRSKLEPHRELIRELRRRGRTYRELARIFQERLGMHVAPSTLHSFVKIRAKHRKHAQYELPPTEINMAQSSTMNQIAELRAKPATPKAQHSRFVFREDEPLKLTNLGGEK